MQFAGIFSMGDDVDAITLYEEYLSLTYELEIFNYLVISFRGTPFSASCMAFLLSRSGTSGGRGLNKGPVTHLAIFGMIM